MRAHTASGILRAVALAPEPTAAAFFGNRIRGSAPALGTGASLALADVVARAGSGVLIRGAVMVAGRVTGFAALLVLGAGNAAAVAVDAVAVVAVAVMVDVGRDDDVAASVAAGEPAPQPARTRQAAVRVTALAVFVALAVRLRGIVRSVRSGSGQFQFVTVNRGV